MLNKIGTSAIGPSFTAEIVAAGLGGLPFSWGADGVFQFAASMTSTQIAAVEAVYANHDPTVPAAPSPPTPRQWLERLSSAKQTAIATAAATTPAILLWVMKATGSQSIDVTLQETKDGVAALVAAGVLDSTDHATLLAP